MSCWINQQVLWLDVSVTDSQGMNVSQRPEHLVSIHLDEEGGHTLLHLDIVPHNSVDGLWDVIHDDIEVDFVSLVSACVKGMLHLNNIGME